MYVQHGLHSDVIHFRAVSTGALVCLFMITVSSAMKWKLTASAKLASKQLYEIGPRIQRNLKSMYFNAVDTLYVLLFVVKQVSFLFNVS